MGFDPRRWRPSPGSRPVTANLEGLLAENAALQREVRQLRQQLEQLRQPRPQDGGSRVSNGAAPTITPQLVERWGQAMARHPGWSGLRIGPPGGLRGLVEELRAQAWNPALSLEEELNRRQAGLGAELAAVLRGPHSRSRWAVRAAFALYGPRASEWLSDEPLRVVGELQRRLDRREQRRRGTRTENHSSTGGSTGGPMPRRKPPPPDPRREALRLLGLEAGASRDMIKRTYRQLAKNHHPDLGGDAEAFLRLDAAYRLLMAG
jgi:DnaJ-domain-containing protein 1